MSLRNCRYLLARSFFDVRIRPQSSLAAIKSCDEIPGPKPVPFYKIFEDLKKNAGRTHKMYVDLHEEFGPLVQFKIPMISMHIFFISDPNLIEELLRQDVTHVRPPIRIWNDYRVRANQAFGTLTTDGEEWARMRKVVDKPMLKPKAVDNYAKDINKVVEDLLDRFERIRGPDMIVENLSSELFNWALESIGSILYEKRMGSLSDVRNPENDNFIEAVRSMFATTVYLFSVPPLLSRFIMRSKWKEHEEAWNTIFRVAEECTSAKLEVIKNVKRNEGEEVGIIEYFIERMPLKEVYSNITELMAGGVDTTSNSSQFVLYEIAKNQNYQDKLYREVQENIKENGLVDLKNLKYLKAFIKETLRLYPVANSVGRVLQNDTVLNGYLLPKGKMIAYSPYALGRNEVFV
ncbi:1,25-dihydroxyvitamin D(3) 24-hydroxylase, mitochondrial [Patella vulgata]|uniref:1,25-dihydroxyvitamin D(3) 24-hydroxylase, mitochondrial n=1 Tax=Patella vulgata TaxID=6465 RepID=UPI00218057E5|nr:1,25-dihydroxyvitamin D(3) 24-hydroxylase, mitochondrial [Patella vulgata]XP_050400662.1 1,25-dihydroxyvitamin D(3) 24-hydroxylase, mitochondrial [Patella vulgata]XP_055956093.1 1,25-dihydroxyvitamin D(3) 24-hydroxylase, mitochondrial [Patella vulgata]